MSEVKRNIVIASEARGVVVTLLKLGIWRSEEIGPQFMVLVFRVPSGTASIYVHRWDARVDAFALPEPGSRTGPRPTSTTPRQRNTLPRDMHDTTISAI